MNNKKIYIILFIILYVFIALVSGIHGFAFFGLANTPILAGMLAVAFEIGQAAVLFSILTNPSQRKKVMPWVLMTLLTLVQVLGNVFNCYKHLILNATDDLKFFKEPIFIWTDLPDAEANVIISYLTGAILPIVGLLLTAMITSFLAKDEEENQVEYIEEVEEEPIEEEVEEEPEKKYVPSDEEKKEIVNIPTTEDYEDYKEEEEHRHEEEPKKENPSDDENASKVIYEEPNDNPEDKANDEYVETIEDKPKKEEYVSPITKEIDGTDPDGGVIGDEGVIVTEEKSEPIIEEIPDLPAPPKMKDSHFLNLKGN